MSAAHRASVRTSREASVARIGAVAASIALVSVMIVGQSRATFSTTTSNPNNAFNAATIALSDDDGGVAMFNVPAMAPGDVATGCIAVTYAGSADPAAVKIYQNAYTETDGAADGATLDSALTVDVDIVDNCTARTKQSDVGLGTLVALAAHTNYSNGLATGWDPIAGPPSQTKSFLFTATFTPSGSNATDNTRIGDTVSNLIFTWETQAGA